MDPRIRFLGCRGPLRDLRRRAISAGFLAASLLFGGTAASCAPAPSTPGTDTARETAAGARTAVEAAPDTNSPSSNDDSVNEPDTRELPEPTVATTLEESSPGEPVEPQGGEETSEAGPADSRVAVETWKVEVLAAFPHDPGAFTQGLLWHAGTLYESTGLYGRSSLRAVAPESGQVLLLRELDRGHFGEGLARVGDRLVQLTWKAGVALVYDRDTFEPLEEWGYNGEGWGLAYDGEHLIMSDGSPRLTFRSAEDFRWVRTVEVTRHGEPLQRINELEWVDGQIWANLWGEDRLVRIDPVSGRVNAEVDAGGLLTPAESRLVDVMNGVAYDPETETYWLTGKFWPKVFQVRLTRAEGGGP